MADQRNLTLGPAATKAPTGAAHYLRRERGRDADQAESAFGHAIIARHVETPRARHADLVLITVAPSFSPVSAQTQTDTSADARLRALYTEEWNWRQQELDAAVRQAIASRASMPRHNRRGSPTGREPRHARHHSRSTSSHPKRRSTRRSSAPLARARQRRAVTEPTKRHSTATRSSGPTSRRARASPPRPRIVRTRAAARRAALLRRADRQHARRPGAWLHGAARVGARTRSAIRN